MGIEENAGADLRDTRCRLLIAEDEWIVACCMEDIVTEQGMMVVGIARTADDVIRMAHQLRPDLVLMDINLAGPNTGIEAARTISHELSLPIVFVSGSCEYPSSRIANIPTCKGVVQKPFTADMVIEQIRLALGPAANASATAPHD